ncbi:LIN1-like protein [Psilocybe cubensis]|uniref:LIN1-like protein n=2 Tax=Psilocybe cubensis TaxID=181762 RepID=A0ACB8H9S9_PSICU|nr:LIN1-like protein [Psilocybe cubensis]KAH9483920.1 LIN1-like protein [Psilocybe cubensis]
MASRAGQKRAATQGSEPSSSSKHQSKKTRFVDPSEDPANFAEQVDSALEGPSRKGKVKTEGYDSDSTDDGEGVVPSRKKGDDDDEVDDMFASEPKANEDTASKKKEEKYMRLADIEGQEFKDESGSEKDSEDDDEPEDEDDAERRKKAGMGYELSSFNMRDEMEEGKFTEDGNYVRTFDPHGVHDRWMEGLDEREIKLARRRKREQEKKQKERMLAEEKELEESGGKSSLETQLLSHLKKGETVLEALQRLGSLAKKTQSKKPKHKTAAANAMQVDQAKVDKPQTHIPTDIETITHLASSLMSMGETDVYSQTYEELVRSVRSSGNVDSSWEPPSADIKYEYKWATPEAGQPDEIFGPFSEEEIRSWYNASYFGTVGEKVKVRRVGGTWGDWDDVVQ